jgi:hypothetical protein
VNDKLERMWKEAVLAQFKALPGICLNGVTKTTETPSDDSRSSDRDLNAGHPEYEAGVLTTKP